MKLASIDIGSNSIKLVVVDAAASDSFAVLAREKEVVRLGHETLREGRLSREAIERAAATIKRFQSIAEGRGAERVAAIATASVREAENSEEFLREVRGRTGLRVEILSGVEEARLIGVAAAYGCAGGASQIVNIDIGGGSTEISFMRDGVPAGLYSVKLGAVGLTENYFTSDPPTRKEVRAVREAVRAALERPARELGALRFERATGTSGTIIAVGEALRLRARREAGDEDERGAEEPSAPVAFARLVRFNERMAAMSESERRDVPGISAQRAEIIVAGGQILEGVMRAFRLNYLRTCDFALREGVIIERLREHEASLRPPVPDLADPRLRGVHAVGLRFGYEEAHARQVARLAEKMFDALAPDYDLSRHHRTLLAAAALLHDAGYHIAHDAHHKHALYLIKHSELTGFSEAERAVVANIARYHRGAPPKERHADFAALNDTDRETVARLASILRVADAFDRSHDGRVQDIECRRDDGALRVELVSRHDCEREIAAAEQKRDLFEQTFDCRLELDVKSPESGV
ncbi:MAG TPA: Ppx/GppA phosphatase family protein [Pyrinomonadaceae bacterium]|nr:Ppx/GppA phosphatase family protein [Pyrinomonadaceae bacterium]